MSGLKLGLVTIWIIFIKSVKRNYEAVAYI